MRRNIPFHIIGASVACEFSAAVDVLWFRLSRRSGDLDETFGRIDTAQFLVRINRGDYWQCGYVIAKGAAGRLKAEGIESLRQRIAQLAPFLTDRVDELKSFDDVSLLTVAVDRLPLWHVNQANSFPTINARARVS
jgi:hypothetical protein